VLLRSVLKHLVDAASNEFLFIADFFKTSPRETFNRIFGRTISLVLENIENYLLTCFDSVGLLIMIKMTHLLRLVMQRRRIPVLDSLFDRISLLLWPRFKQVFDANLKSIRNVNIKKIGHIDVTPHFVSRRYAHFITSLITLQSGSDSGIGGGGENMMVHDIQLIRNEMVALLDRLAEAVRGGAALRRPANAPERAVRRRPHPELLSAAAAIRAAGPVNRRCSCFLLPAVCNPLHFPI
jgi:hypothetical protein